MLDFSKASTQMMRRLFAILCLPWQLQLSLCLSLDGINSRESKGGKLKPEHTRAPNQCGQARCNHCILDPDGRLLKVGKSFAAVEFGSSDRH